MAYTYKHGVLTHMGHTYHIIIPINIPHLYVMAQAVKKYFQGIYPGDKVAVFEEFRGGWSCRTPGSAPRLPISEIMGIEFRTGTYGE